MEGMSAKQEIHYAENVVFQIFVNITAKRNKYLQPHIYFQNTRYSPLFVIFVPEIPINA